MEQRRMGKGTEVIFPRLLLSERWKAAWNGCVYQASLPVIRLEDAGSGCTKFVAPGRGTHKPPDLLED